MIITKNQVIREIGYEKVAEEVHKDYHRFDILPDDEALPKAYLAFTVTDKGYFLLQAGFDDWHDHFDLCTNEEENLKETFAFFNNLVAGKFYLIKKVDEDGVYISGSIVNSKTDLCFHAPLSLGSKVKSQQLLKVVFNKPYEEHKTENP